MKYIRTKDGIFAYNDLRVRLTGDYIHERVADNIEDLCDGYVIVDTENKNSKPRFQEEPWEKPPLHLLKDGYEIYGAIWTDKGLIYVAKMNEKGELELL